MRPGLRKHLCFPGKPAAGKGDGDNGVQQGRKPAAGTDDAAPAVDVSRPFKFTFYGTGCSVSLAAKHRFNLASVQENSVANAGKAFREVHTMPWRRSAWR